MRSARLSGPAPYGAGPFYFKQVCIKGGIRISGYLLRSSEGHSKKTIHHRDTEDTEKFKKQSGLLCALCASSERNERVVKRIINSDNSD